MLRSWNPFRSRQEGAAAPECSGPPGKRAYAIGDVHGRADLLELMLARIADDIASRPECETYIVFLGDLIDRGADSAGVIDRLLTTNWGPVKPVYLMGNHEEMLLRILDGEPDIIHQWLRYGGYECAQSYGAPVARMIADPDESAVAALRAHIPKAHVDFVRGFADSFRFGDYLFVHAGIRPGVPLEQQSVQDLRWIREGFLDVARNDAFMVVHGHTIVTTLEEKGRRIGIDIGAYATGRLGGLRVEQSDREFITVGESPAELTKRA